MSLTSTALERTKLTKFVVVLIAVGGIFTFFQLSWLEDPIFTVKVAVVTTLYSGASAEEVELEVTNPIELAIQEMPELDYVQSISRAGLSVIKVYIKQSYWADALPQVWDQLRNKVGDVAGSLPPGAETPQVADDFGFVYGFLLMVYTDDFTDAELETFVKSIRKELSIVEGVARVDSWGAQTKVVYLEVKQSQVSQLGLTEADLQTTMLAQNMVVDAGHIDYQSERLRVAPTGTFASVEDIEDLTFRASILSKLSAGKQQIAQDPSNIAKVLSDDTNDLIRLGDIADIRRGYLDPPLTLARYNGKRAIALAVAPGAGTNIVQIGEALRNRLAELEEELPRGIGIAWISDQGQVVEDSIVGFMINLLEAVAIVFIVLAVSMGVRMGIIIGLGGLVLVILATFTVMGILDIPLQRISLGALIIAMGMMVDNAIVVADGMVKRMKAGMARREAAIKAASDPSMALLGATIIACMFFYPIFAAQSDAGEYCRTMFMVVAICLLMSWAFSMTVVPLMCLEMLPEPKTGRPGESEDPYDTGFYRTFREFLRGVIRARFLFMGVLIAVLVMSVYGFGYVQQMFFPDSSRNQFMVDYWAPEGTRIQQVSEDIRLLESHFSADERVVDVSTFIGQGPPRFYLPVDPELPYASYGQLIVNTQTYGDVNTLIPELEAWMQANVPQALTRTRKYGVGPSDTWKIEARFSGPAEADPVILRQLAQQGINILRSNPYAKEVRTDWRQRVKSIVPVLDQAGARWSGVSRKDVALATKRAFDGKLVGLYRESDELMPILLRHVDDERHSAAVLGALQVISPMETSSIPLSQITSEVKVAWEDPIIWRFDRRRAITVQCSPDGVTAAALREMVLPEFEAVELPPGYKLEWDGEHDSTVTGQASLVPGLTPVAVITVLILVALFNGYRPALVITGVIPFVLIGISIGLLTTGQPFGFMALLGAMSLCGMIIKNGIVLMDEINVELAGGKTPDVAIVNAAVSRLQPVALAAATTILGVAPLLQDVFWVAMAVTIMFGLLLGAALSMLVVPVLYAILFKVRMP